MGVVYLARERALERFVAIKVLRPELALAQEGRERFRREARVAAQLTHPGISPLHTFGEVAGIWYFVMAMCAARRSPSGCGSRDACRATRRSHFTEIANDDQSGRIAAASSIATSSRRTFFIDAESGRAILADFGSRR